MENSIELHMYVVIYANQNSDMGHIPPSERGAFGNNEKRH